MLLAPRSKEVKNSWRVLKVYKKTPKLNLQHSLATFFVSKI